MSTESSFGGWSEDADPAIDLDSSLDHPDGERYERVDLIGVGGMGRVFEAFDRRLGRRVALKEVAPHLAGTAVARRLADEALLAADREHPNIVSVHDSGRTEDGRLYYTMRLVRGRSLAERLADAPDARARAALLRHLLDACHAVGYAHSRGVVHRDLKPANILVGEFGECQVVDWGLARRLVDGVVAGGPSGTAAYMSPEAKAGGPIDRRADVYGLGVTLRAVAGDDPPPDLAAVADRATAREPEQRYADARELALDLERFLDGRRVAAYAYSPLELLRRLAAAWRAPLLVGAVAALVLAAVAVDAWVRTGRSRDRAVSAEGDARRALAAADRHVAASLQAQAATALRDGRFPAAEVLAAHALRRGESPVARGVLMASGSARPSAVDVRPLPDCEGLALGPAESLCWQGSGLAVWRDGAVAWTRAGQVSDALVVGERIALMVEDRDLEVRSRSDGALQATHEVLLGPSGLVSLGASVGLANDVGFNVISLESGERWDSAVCGVEHPATTMALRPDRVFVVCVGYGVVEVVRGAPPRLILATEEGRPEPSILRWAGDVLLGATTGGQVQVIDPAGGLRAVHQVLPGTIDRLLPLRGASLVAIAGGRGGVRLWDLAAGVELTRLPAPTRAVLALGPRDLLVAGDDLRRWSLPERLAPPRWRSPAGHASVAVSPDGRWVAGARGDGVVSVWATEDGAAVAELRWQDRVAKAVAFSPDGRLLAATGLGDASVRTWAVGTWEPLDRFPGGPLRRAGVLADGRIWGSGYGAGVDLDLAAPSQRFTADATIQDAASSADGAWLAVLDQGGGLYRQRSGGAALLRLPGRFPGRSVAIDGSGRVAVAREDSLLLLDEGALVATLRAEGAGLISSALSPDGRWAAAGRLDGTVLLWSVTEQRLVASLVGHQDRVASLVFGTDSDTLITAGWDGAVRSWRLANALRPADELLAEVERAWGIGLTEALAGAR